MRAWLIGVGFVAALALAACWFVFGYWWDNSWRMWQDFHWSVVVGTFVPNGFNVFQATWVFYLLVGLVVIGIGAFFANAIESALGGLTVVFGVILVIAAIVVAIVAIPHKEASYAGKTTLVVEDLDKPPASLQFLMDSVQASSGEECDLVGTTRGITSCIVEEEIDLEWEPRPASATAARNKLVRASEGDTFSYVMTDTINYSKTAQGNYWSAIRDGKKKKPIDGVLTWDGTASNPSKCEFAGDHELNYAFKGSWGTNLADLIAKEYHDHLYDQNDMWGYCVDGKPVIAIPTVKREGYKHVATDRFGGLLLVTGSPSGEPVFELVENVSAGDYPGPVYPSSLAERQRDSFKMSAGVLDKWLRGFGMEASSVSSQMGNSSEFLLESAKDGRLYWVTPLKPAKGDSQRITTYSVIPADAATSGELNDQTMYMHSDINEMVDLPTMQDRVTNEINAKEPAFFGGDPAGRLAEFLPLTSDTWQVYAERGGTVVYRIQISTNEALRPEVVKLSGATGSPVDTGNSDDGQEGAPTLNCSSDAAAMAVIDLSECMKMYSDELARRAG